MIPDILKKVVKIGWGIAETKKAAKSAGIAGIGGVVCALLQPLLVGTPLGDPVVGAPVVIWAVNALKELFRNNVGRLGA